MLLRLLPAVRRGLSRRLAGRRTRGGKGSAEHGSRRRTILARAARREALQRDSAAGGAKTGRDASEKYNQAELLSMENEKLVKAWLSLLEQFTVLEDEVKAKD